MHLSESVYYTVQAYMTVLSDTYEKKVAATKIYLIRRLYNLRMKESDSITGLCREGLYVVLPEVVTVVGEYNCTAVYLNTA
jgi:hypothetical protein